MIFDVLTIFPGFFTSPLEETILKRAREKGLLEVVTRDIRGYATDKHTKTDDIPFGGGPGMVMKPEPVVAAIEAARADGASRVLLLDPIGRRFDQAFARELVRDPRARIDQRAGGERGARIALVCGRYEGFDERIRPFADGELSIGDVVLSGGEPAALLVIDACARLLDGVLGNEASTGSESFAGEGPSGPLLLEAPSFTRPQSFRGSEVPDVLRSGDHEAIRRWRRTESLRRTVERRPDLVRSARESGRFSAEDEKLLDEIQKSK